MRAPGSWWGWRKRKRANSLPQDAERFSDTSWQIHRQWRAGDSSWPNIDTPNQTQTHATVNSHNSWRGDHNNGTILRRTTPPREIQISAPINYTPTPTARHSSDEADGPSQKSRQVELSYATERLLVLWLPLQQNDLPRHSQTPGPEREVADMLNTKHGRHYMVYDVSEQPSRAVMEHPGRVCELGWARGLAPPLERLCALCKHLESWLAADPANVAVLRSCGSRERLAVAVSAYLRYSSICGKQEHALDRCSMKRFLDGSPSLPPSHRRYVEYFSGLLAGGIRVNAAPVWLTHVTVVGAPPLSHVFLKLYEGMVPIYTSNIYSLGSGARQFTAALGPSPAGVAVRGDVLVRCYSRPPPSAISLHSSLPNRRLLFSCQFHTCAVADYTLIFTKCDLDYACNDENFPPDGSVEIQVSGGRFAPAPTPAVRIVAADDALARYDSLQNLTTISMTSNTSGTSGANSSGRLSGASSHHNHNNSSSLSTRTSELVPIARTSDTDEEANGARGGEPEGPIYATVARRAAAASNGVQNGSSGSGQARAVSNGAGGPSSPLSASMDSGISSAGRRQGSPSPGAKRKELDDLLRDMMRTVEALPGPAVNTSARNERERERPHRSHSSAATDHNMPVYSQQPHRSQSSASDIPYHARPDSRPFTYGAQAPDPTMLRCQPGLSSPSLVRKVLRPTYKEENPLDFKINGFNDAQPDAIDGLFTTNANDLYRMGERGEARREALVRSPSPNRSIKGVIVNGLPPPLSPVLPRKEHRFLHEETITTLTRRPGYNSNSSYAGSEPPAIRESIEHINGGINHGDSSESDGLTWLQRQQQRLRSRRDARLRESRLPLDRSMTGRTSASHRFDGYTSDTTAFADDDDDFSIPLHVQTVGRTHAMPTNEPILPNRTSSRKFMSIDRRVMRDRSVSPSGVDMLDSPRDPGIMSSHNGTMTREESLSSWRSVSVSEWEGADGELESRGGTPAFPTTPRTPYPAPHTPPNRLPPRSPVAQRKDFSSMLGRSPSSPHPPTTPVTPELHDVSPELVKFVKDTSKFWYKPNISRDEAIALLQTQEAGAFIIRDSNSFPNAFGLALKVAPPPGASLGSIDLVRHFLIEPTSRGVRLKGCVDEPVFSSLSALVYQHSVTPLALPARLKLPGSDPAPPGPAGAARALLATGAACSVLYIGGSGCEALTGPEAVMRTAAKLFTQRPDITPAIVHFKVSPAGITLTDSTRRLFFRRHYPTSAVSFCGLDPGDRRWNHKVDANGIPSPNRMFGFIARRTGSSTDNECHIFAELEPEQPATAIVNFVSKVMLGQAPPQNIV